MSLLLGGLVAHAQVSPATALAAVANGPKFAATSEKTARNDVRKPAATPTPPPASATPAPRKPGFFSHFFGSKATPAPATPAPASATPTPKPKPKPRKAAPDDEEDAPKKHDTTEAHGNGAEKSADKNSEKSADKTAETSTEKSEVKPEEKTSETPPADTTAKQDGPPKEGEEAKVAAPPEHKAPTPPAPKSGKRGAKTDKSAKETAKEPPKEAAKEQQALEAALKGGDAHEIEDARYDYAKARAVNDQSILNLKDKADSATTEEEGRKDLRAYNRALFEKMRKLEPSISERIDRMETAVLKRLGGAGEH